MLKFILKHEVTLDSETKHTSPRLLAISPRRLFPPIFNTHRNQLKAKILLEDRRDDTLQYLPPYC